MSATLVNSLRLEVLSLVERVAALEAALAAAAVTPAAVEAAPAPVSNLVSGYFSVPVEAVTPVAAEAPVVAETPVPDFVDDDDA